MEDATVCEGTMKAMLFCQADVLHIHWPDNILRSRRWCAAAARVAVLFTLLSLRRWRGTKIVWTAHNSFSHEHHHPKLEQLFWKGLFKRLDGIIAHSNTVCAELRERTGGRIPICVIPLSHFRGLYPSPSAGPRPPAAIRRLGFVGRIRQYKGVPDLIEAFLPYADPDVRLVVRGKPENPEIAAAMTNLCARDARIDLRLGFLSPADLTNEIAALDAVVLPFKWVTNSGSALLSLSLGTRVVVPGTAYFLELQSEFGPEWVYCYEGDLSPSVIAGICAWTKRPTSRPAPELSEQRGLPWAAKATFAFFQTVMVTP